MRCHPHPFPGTAIRGTHRASCGDGDVEVGVIHVVGLWWLAASTGHFTNDQRPAQPLHDVSKFLSGTGCHTTGEDGHTLLGTIAFTWRTEALQHRVKSTPYLSYPVQMRRSRPQVESCSLVSICGPLASVCPCDTGTAIHMPTHCHVLLVVK